MAPKTAVKTAPKTAPKTAVKKTSGPKKTSGKKQAKKVTKASKKVDTKAPVTEPVVPATAPAIAATTAMATTAPVTATVVDPVETPEEVSFTEDFQILLTQLKNVQNVLRDMTAHATKLERRVEKERKVLLKRANGKVKRKQDPNRPPSGFSKPGKISPELLKFLQAQKTKMTDDNLIARTDVTKAISDYCRNNGLQDQKDKRRLNADKTLTKLLNLKKGDELTFFNLQKFMKVHFPNKEGVYPTA